MGYSNDPVGDFLKHLGWLLLFAGIGTLALLGSCAYALYWLIIFLI